MRQKGCVIFTKLLYVYIHVPETLENYLTWGVAIEFITELKNSLRIFMKNIDLST